MKLPIVPEEWGSKTLPRVLSGEKKDSFGSREIRE